MASILNWIHISDIHFGDGTHRHLIDKNQILERMLEDIEYLSIDESTSPDCIFITGDISYSGGSRSGDEFEKATGWIDRLLEKIKLNRSQVFVVPGNHDLDLSNDESRELKYMLESLRSGSALLDNLEVESFEALRLRYQKFSEFSSQFAEVETFGSIGHWSKRIESSSDSPVQVRIFGLNTSSITKIRDNEGKLQIGLEALPEKNTDEIFLALTHHPVSEEWLRDHSSIQRRFTQRFQIHLCGHVHNQEIEELRCGGLSSLLTVISGASHGEEGEETGYGYSFGSLVVEEDEIVARIWPRKFYLDKQEFDRHAELLGRGSDYSEHLIEKISPHSLRSTTSSDGAIREQVEKVNSLEGVLSSLNYLLNQIDHQDLVSYANQALNDVDGALRRLAHMKQTPELTAGAYYRFVNRKIEDYPSGGAIWAISTMMSVEWTDDPYEKRFLKANIDAANRGVKIERIFVVPENIVDELLDDKAIKIQVEHKNLSALLVVKERLAEFDVDLLNKIGPGLIAFDEEVVMVDRHNDDGRVRGFGTFHQSEVESWKNTYWNLREHAIPLTT